MPKKIQTNPKAVEARERKDAVKKDKQEKEKRAKEDALWVETDKHILQKEDRKKQSEDKKAQEAERKKAAREALAREENELAKQYTKNLPTPKVTQAEIARRKQIEELAAKKREEQDKKQEAELQENVNRIIQLERAEHGENYLEARTVDEALGHMSIATGTPDKHPEKRVKASYAAFEEKMIPIVREDNPTLKLSQLKELVWKLWQKSPENPMNQQA
eukprot:Phypoly_transcript_15098.p1 GENE.Phypoly_transcript_15098~~Phypoly_transcript_15098.p1  ORF type:complete len:218 (+),score=77.20 Phypoly_transcript_15098:128-781(+)